MSLCYLPITHRVLKSKYNQRPKRRMRVAQCMVALTTCIALASVTPAFGQYTLIDLGSLIGPSGQSIPRDLNDLGQVVGYSQNASGSESFIWDIDNGMRSLGPIPVGVFQDNAYGINNLGQVVGTEGAQIGSRAFIWDEVNGKRYLPDFPAGQSASGALSINDAGQIVGQVATLNDVYKPGLWETANTPPTLINDLTLGLGHEYARDINNNGQVVWTHSYGDDQSFVWDPVNGSQPLPDLPGGDVDTTAFAINDFGQVVGSSHSAQGNQAYIWDSSNGMRDLGTFPDSTLNSTFARDINNSGEVVGRAWGGAFIWDEINGMRDIETLLDASGNGWNLSEAVAINEAGWIVATAKNGSGPFHAVLLIPEPHTVALLTISACALSRRKRR